MMIAVQRAALRQQTRPAARAFASTAPNLSRPSHAKNGQKAGKFKHRSEVMSKGCGLLAAGAIGGVAFLDRKHRLQAQPKDMGKVSRPSRNINEVVLGTDHESTAASHGAIALVFWNQGKLEEALEEYRKALAIQESTLGKEHPETAVTYGNIGSVLANLGKHNEALAEYQKALAILESAQGKDNPETARTYRSIGSVIDDKQALVEYQKALAILESALGKDHPETDRTYHDTATVLAKQVRYEAALVEYWKALRILEMALGKDHPHTMPTKGNIDTVNERLSE